MEGELDTGYEREREREREREWAMQQNKLPPKHVKKWHFSQVKNVSLKCSLGGISKYLELAIFGISHSYPTLKISAK